MKNSMFDKNQFYIIRAENAGVFMAKIESIEGNTAVCNSLRRLYYWEGALDVTQNGKMTLEKFLELTRNAYGSEIIKQIQ